MLFSVILRFFIFPKEFPNDFSRSDFLWEIPEVVLVFSYTHTAGFFHFVETVEFSGMFSKGCGKMFENVENQNFVRNLRKKETEERAFRQKSEKNRGKNTEKTGSPHKST